MKTNLLEKCTKEELIDIIIAYDDYQSKCDKDELSSISSFILSNTIAKSRYTDKEEYENNKYIKPKTLEDRIEKADRTDELRRLLFSNTLRRPRFRIDDYVEDVINKEYYIIIGINKIEDKIVYKLKNGPKISKLEEKYLMTVTPTNFININGDIIITEAKRR